MNDQWNQGWNGDQQGEHHHSPDEQHTDQQAPGSEEAPQEQPVDESAGVEDTASEPEEEEQEEDASVYDVSANGGSSAGKYSDNDLRYIFRFVHQISIAPAGKRQAFLDVLGLGNSDMASVVTSLYPAEGRASNLFELYTLAEQLNPEGDPIAYGQSIVRLMGTLGNMDTDDIRTLSKSIDAISEEYSPGVDLIRYTRRQTPQDVAQKIIAIIPAWSQEARQFLDWATDLLMIWPRKES